VHAFWIIFLFLIGACVGSFLNVIIWRLPRGESIVFPGSHCPACGKAIKWYDNIPIVSWLLLRGRCRACGVRISPRYIFIEVLTALLVVALYVCYFVLELRDGVGEFSDNWPMFAAHAALLCGLLAASAVDIELFIVPLPVMWVCAAIGIIAATADPAPASAPAKLYDWHVLMVRATPTAAMVCLAACAGLVLAKVLMRFGLIQPSFLDAQDAAVPAPAMPPKGARVRPQIAKSAAKDAAKLKSASVAITADSGVNVRFEIMRELLFLAPAIFLGLAAYLACRYVPAVREAAQAAFDPLRGNLQNHLAGGMGAVLGMLAGIAWLWGTRIFGTLALGKEAMGMGDVHIMAAIGACGGWMVATITFFAAPVFGLLWAIYLLLAKGKRELPYGPWLAFGAGFVLVFYDAILSKLLMPGQW
jgi:leader peptidase (prepilin peptidase)/N-methyltransferase